MGKVIFMSCFPIEEKKAEHKAKNPAVNRMPITLAAIFFVALAVIGIAPASAAIDTTNITDAINLIGTVGSAFITALGTIFVDNLGTILTLVAVGIVIMVFSGFGAMIVRFAFSLIGNIGQEMDHRFIKRR